MSVAKQMKDSIKIIIAILVTLILVDVAGWEAWSISGQQPSDGFYLGAMTAKVLGPVK